MRLVLRAAVLPLLAMVAALILVPSAAHASSVAPPAAGLSVTGIKNTEGSLVFVLTPRFTSTRIAASAVRVKVGQTQLAIKTTEAQANADIPKRAVMLVLDNSANVSAVQLDSERSAARTLANNLPDDALVGLAVVGPENTVVLQPTADRRALTSAMEIAPSGQRALFSALNSAQAALGAVGQGAEKRIVIIGPGTDSTGASSTQISNLLALDGIVTDAIVTTPDPLRALVNANGGTMRTASDKASFTQAGMAAATMLQPALLVTATVPPSLAGQKSTVVTSIDGTQLSASTDLTLAGVATVGAETANSRSLAWVPLWAPWALAALVFLGLIVALLTLVWPRSLKDERIRQISNFGPAAKAAPAPKTPSDAPVSSVIARTALAATASVVRSGRMDERITRRLERAGMRMRSHEWVLLRACVMITVGALLFILAGPVGGIIGVAIGYVSTLLYQTVRIDRRSTQFAEQLPDALQLVIGSLKSGFSLSQAFDSLVRESPEPVASEFGRALSEHRLGADISDSLERVAKRSESEDLEWTVMAVRIQREVGGNLAEVLQNTVDTMRERGRLRRHVRSLSAEGRISAYVLIGLPLALGMFMFIYRRAYMAPLLTDPVGIIMLSLGGLLFILGIFWMTRVIKVEA